MGTLKGLKRLRILVVKPSSFGDIVHLFPALAMMRDQFPEAELDFVVNPEFSSLLKYSPFPVSRKIIFERRKLGGMRFFPELSALRKNLRQKKYDVVIDFQGLFRSGFITSLCRAEIKAGFAGARERSAEIFYNRRIAVNGSHAVERYAALAKELFNIDGDVYQPELPVDEEALSTLPELPDRYMVLLPGTRWESKRFPAEFFGKLCSNIKSAIPDMEFIAAGSAGERSGSSHRYHASRAG